jgi:hypothetical protein
MNQAEIAVKTQWTRLVGCEWKTFRAGDRTRTGDVQLGKLAFYH